MRYNDTNQQGGLQLTADRWEDWVKAAEAREFNGQQAWNKGSQGYRSGFHYNESFSGTIDLARKGWAEGTRQILEGLEGAAADQDSGNLTAPAWDYDIAGMAPDVAAFCAGEPEHMATPDIASMDGNAPVVRLVLPGAYASGIRPEQVIARGVAVLSYLSALQTAGYGVELWWFASTHPDRITKAVGSTFTAAVRVSDPSQPVDIDRAAFALANPDMLRRLWFGIVEQDSRLKALGDGYGTVGNSILPTLGEDAQTVVLPDITSATPGWVDMAVEEIRPHFAELLKLDEAA